MIDYTATAKKIKRLQRIQAMQDNASYIRNWLAFQNLIHREKMKIGIV